MPRAGGRPSLLEWGDDLVIDDRYLNWMNTDPGYLAALAEEERIVAQVDRDLPWHHPSAGLATVRGLIAELEHDPVLDNLCYGAVWDLRVFQFELEYAERIGTRFYFWAAYYRRVFFPARRRILARVRCDRLIGYPVWPEPYSERARASSVPISCRFFLTRQEPTDTF
jgi:hypothetical protein